VVTPAELIASKVLAFQMRRGKPKSGTDWRDIAELLLAFPELKQPAGPVAERLNAAGADVNVFTAWNELVSQDIQPENENEEF
jgi:hypothetical protein